MGEVIIDVRERDEFDAEHIKNSINVPLSTFSSQAPGILTQFMDRKVVIMCRSGNRAKMAKQQALQLGFSPDAGYSIYEGGIIKWKSEGKETIAQKKGHLPLLRQTHLIAGMMAFVGVLLGYTVHNGFFALSGFVGLGMTFAGATGNCLLSNFLAFAPWNKSIPEIKKEACIAGTGTSNCSN
ncbi:MAG: rhodanese-like domain-containing protein [Bdellovibrionales bacterium]|nr:rhodanese-like domain-containing protein [Bdellovibrionales bacterium]